MNLPTLDKLQFEGKRVLVRADLDTDPNMESFRIKALVPTLDYIRDRGGKIILIGHRGRPNGKVDESLSLKPFEKVFEKWDLEVLENLRFDPREESNSEEFAKELSEKGDVFVNEAFAASHRNHASIVGVPKFLEHAAGLRFMQEIDNLSKVFDNPKRPVTSIISGIKEDKLSYIESFEKFCDRILVGGRLPEFIEKKPELEEKFSDGKVFVARLNQDKEDITINSIEGFEDEIKKARTIVVFGPVGKFEDMGQRLGTKRVFEAVVENKDAFKVAGGGDTVKSLETFELMDKFDWVSVAGGASLQFLAKGTLPGIEALS